MAAAEVTLTTGVGLDGTRARRAVVTAPGAEEERAIAEEGERLLPAERVTLLLGRCAEVGGARGADVARALTAGDRVALLLALRRAASGDALPCVLACPWPDCGERLDLDLRVGDLLGDAEPGAAGDPLGDVEVDGARVRFRLPTGADEERAARLALADAPGAARALLAACLIDDDGLGADDGVLAEAIATAITERDPRAEISLGLTCPACGRDGEVPFDVAAYVWEELRERARQLEREVHLLASRYGWSERDITALTPRRRARYVELVEAEAPRR